MDDDRDVQLCDLAEQLSRCQFVCVYGRNEKVHMHVPRHTLNLFTGSACTAYSAYLWSSCSSILVWSNVVCFATSVVYHGLHTLGYEDDALRLMRYDTSAVVLVMSMTTLHSSNHDLLLYTITRMMAFTVLWLLSFNVLKGLPMNPVISIMHMMSVVFTANLAVETCHL